MAVPLSSERFLLTELCRNTPSCKSGTIQEILSRISGQLVEMGAQMPLEMA
jgi:hypothetical protein